MKFIITGIALGLIYMADCIKVEKWNHRGADWNAVGRSGRNHEFLSFIFGGDSNKDDEGASPDTNKGGNQGSSQKPAQGGSQKPAQGSTQGSTQGGSQGSSQGGSQGGKAGGQGTQPIPKTRGHKLFGGDNQSQSSIDSAQNSQQSDQESQEENNHQTFAHQKTKRVNHDLFSGITGPDNNPTSSEISSARSDAESQQSKEDSEASSNQSELESQQSSAESAKGGWW